MADGPDLDLPNALQIHTHRIGVPAGAVAVLGPLHAVKATATFEPRIPRSRAAFQPAKEAVECPVEAAQGGLLAGKRPAPYRVDPALSL